MDRQRSGDEGIKRSVWLQVEGSQEERPVGRKLSASHVRGNCLANILALGQDTGQIHNVACQASNRQSNVLRCSRNGPSHSEAGEWLRGGPKAPVATVQGLRRRGSPRIAQAPIARRGADVSWQRGGRIPPRPGSSEAIVHREAGLQPHCVLRWHGWKGGAPSDRDLRGCLVTSEPLRGVKSSEEGCGDLVVMLIG